ncbi:MAG: helix-turn-helix domain-containing protein [bacterium]|nr:helix-turn-helix domain-containing protein [bacterium]
MHTFGRRLKGFRERVGLTQQKLAIRIGVSRGTISNWERSQYAPTLLKDRVIFDPLVQALRLSESESDQLIYAAQLPEGYSPTEVEQTTLARVTESRVKRMVVEHIELPGALQRPPVPKFVVPFRDSEDFFGREGDLQALRTALREGVAARPHPVMLTGLGGIGKTQLAVTYAYCSQNIYPDGVYWVNASEDWQDGLANLAERIGLRADDAPESERRRRLALGFADFLNAHPKALLVFDNVKDPRLLCTAWLGFIPADLPCHLLLTTTRRRIPDLSFTVIDVRELQESAALDLLLSKPSRHRALSDIQENSDSPEGKAARAICRSLGYLPLALALAAAYLGKYPKISLSGYHRRLEKKGRLDTVDASDVDSLDLPTEHAAAVTATLKMQWDALQSTDARRVLQTAALLGEATQIPCARLALLTGLTGEAKEGYHAPLDEALATLQEFCLIEELIEHEIRLHPLTREFAANKISDRANFAEVCARQMANALWDMKRLHTEAVKRGIDAVIADLRSALKICLPSREGSRKKLNALLRPLDLEAHHLRNWDPSRQPGFFLQQLRNRCFELNASELQACAEAQLESQHLGYLRERFKANRDSEALVRRIMGHAKSVSGVTFTPDSRSIVSVSYDGTLRVCDIATGQVVRMLEDDMNSVISVAVTPDGRYVVYTSRKNINIWDLAEGRLVKILEGHQDNVRGVTVNSDGCFAVSASGDGTCKVWNLADGQIIRTFEGHTRGVTGLALACDDNFVVSMSRMDTTLIKWDVSNGEVVWKATWKVECKREYSMIRSALHTIAVTPHFVITPSEDNVLNVWDLTTGQLVETLKGHTNTIGSVAVAPDGSYVISASYDNILRIWDLVSSQPMEILSHTIAHIVAIAPNGQYAASASWDGTIKIWDLTTKQSFNKTFDGHASLVHDVIAVPDNRFAISASADHTLKVWNLATGHVVQTFKGHTAEVISTAIMPDDQFFISASHDETLRVWNLGTGQTVQTFSDIEIPFIDVVAATSSYVISACNTTYTDDYGKEHRHETLEIWDLSTGQVVGELKDHTGAVNDVAVTADGRLAISASSDKTLKVWDMETKQCIQTLEGHTASVESVAVTPNGYLAISSSVDTTIRVWDLATGHTTLVLKGHTHVVIDVALTPDNRFAISVSFDNTLRIWDLVTGRAVLTLATSTPLRCCAVTPDGQTILAGDYAGVVHFIEWVGMSDVTKQLDNGKLFDFGGSE